MKKKIISASRRTDIPAFYSEWFRNRIDSGYCVYPNPFYPKQFHKVDLRPEAVAGFVFWTRHAGPIMPLLPALDSRGYTYYFQYTLVNYPGNIDPRSPSPDVARRTFRELSQMIGKEKVVWRYDPIILGDHLDENWHKDNFQRILDAIRNYTQCLVVSIVDPYRKTRRRLAGKEVAYNAEAYADILGWIAKRSVERGIQIQSCAEPDLSVEGIEPGPCVDALLLAETAGQPLTESPKLHKQRKGCLCHQSIDIGVNNTCGFGCPYCYATSDHETALENLKNHNPTWSCITGDTGKAEKPFDKTRDRRVLVSTGGR